MKTIRVGVHGGVVQWVEGIPEGVEVKVFDYDTYGVDGRRLTPAHLSVLLSIKDLASSSCGHCQVQSHEFV